MENTPYDIWSIEQKVWLEKDNGKFYDLICPEEAEEIIAYKIPTLAPKVGDLFELDNCLSEERNLAYVDSIHGRNVVLKGLFMDDRYKHLFNQRCRGDCSKERKIPFIPSYSKKVELYLLNVNSNFDVLDAFPICLNPNKKRILEERLKKPVINTFHGRSLILNVRE